MRYVNLFKNQRYGFDNVWSSIESKKYAIWNTYPT